MSSQIGEDPEEQPGDSRRALLADTVALRPMRGDDVEATVAVAGEAFGFDAGEESIGRRWRLRVEHLLRSDPQGSFLAESDGRAIGIAQALRRERLWCLSLLAVRPGAQSAGVGGRLLELALAYAKPGDDGLVVSANDPRALALYERAGLSPRATVEAFGQVSREALRRPQAGVEEGATGDLEALGAISRQLRGAPHTADLAFVLGQGAVLLGLADRGFAVAIPGHGVWLLAALDEQAAAALLWSALAHVGETERPIIRWITADQEWAKDIALQAGLQLRPYGALCVRGQPGPLRPYIPSGPFG